MRRQRVIKTKYEEWRLVAVNYMTAGMTAAVIFLNYIANYADDSV